MKKFRCFMQIAYSPNNALITVSCRLREGCERLRFQHTYSGKEFLQAFRSIAQPQGFAGKARLSLTAHCVVLISRISMKSRDARKVDSLPGPFIALCGTKSCPTFMSEAQPSGSVLRASMILRMVVSSIFESRFPPASPLTFAFDFDCDCWVAFACADVMG